MECVYYLWQLVFAEIINNDELLLCTIITWHIHACYDRHLIIFMTWCTLYYDTNWLVYCSFIFGICYFNLILDISFIVCSYIICTCTFSFILAHSLGVLISLICISRSGAIYRWSGIWRGSHASWGELSSLCSILVFSLYINPIVSCDSRYIGLGAYSFPLFICYHVWLFICYIAVLSYHHSDYIASAGYFRFSIYAWGIFLANICRWLSSRLCFHVFWEAGRDRLVVRLFLHLTLPSWRVCFQITTWSRKRKWGRIGFRKLAIILLTSGNKWFLVALSNCMANGSQLHASS